jgi:hypothetical protein
MKRKSKSDVVAFCEANGIELTDEQWGSSADGRHIHAQAPDGFQFVKSGTDNAGCWDGKGVDWDFVWGEIQIEPATEDEDE